jgi:hypothetical protein
MRPWVSEREARCCHVCRRHRVQQHTTGAGRSHRRTPPLHTHAHTATVEMLEAASSAAPAPLQFINRLNPPRWLFRTIACLVLGGQVISRICRGESWVWVCCGHALPLPS